MAATGASGGGSGGRSKLTVAAVLGVIVTAIGVVSDGFGLVDRIRGEPMPVLAGRVEVANVTPHATFDDWRKKLEKLRRQPGVARVIDREYTPAQLDAIGTLLEVDFKLEGYAGREVRLLWSLLDRDGRPAGGDDYADRDAAGFQPEAAGRGATFPIWIPPPRRDGRYIVRVALIDDQDVQLDSADSRPFEANRAEFLR